MNRRFKIAVLAAAMASIFSGCSRVDFPPSAHADQTTQATDANQTTAVKPLVNTRGVPDFSALVEQEGAAVVNVTVERATPAANSPQQRMPQGIPFPFPFNGPNGPQGPQQGQPQTAQGSGFIIKPDGYILTNAHVIGDGGEVTVRLTDKREFKAKIIGIDVRTDVALIKIEGGNLPVVPIGNPEKAKVGAWVAAIGSPFGFENSISAGIISAKGRTLPDESFVPFIQTDVAVNPGNSGGPLFDIDGNVIGINSMIYSRTGGYMGVSFAIPIDIAMNVADQLQAHGKVTRGKIGVQIQELTRELAKSFGMKDPNGALVSSVESGGPADKAGFKSGDVITEFNGKAVVDSRDLPRIVAAIKPGSQVDAKIQRNGKEETLKVTVGEIQPSAKVADAGGKSPAEATGKLGLAVQDLTAEQRQQLDVKGGVVVGNVDGPAARAGIQEGDVVLAVNGQQIESVSHFKTLVDKAGQGRPLALLIQRGEARLYVPVLAG
ncbi:MAG: DegQ family serine endoprotease [Betaproteobacteria bacterium]